MEAVRRGELKRLWVFCPPRHGKTEQNTVRFAAWWLETAPRARVIVWAYNQTYAEKISRKIRRIVAPRMPLASDRKAVGDWETAAGGGVRAAGIGAGVTGFGADLILIDDPVKSREEADSKAYRDRCYDSYVDDLKTRLQPGGAIVGTMTRWHEDDLAGRILASDEAPRWDVLRLPALAESGEDDPLGRAEGESLCPALYDATHLEEVRKDHPGSFESLYQGRPSPADGSLFRASWFRSWRPEGDDLYRLGGRDGAPDRVVVRRDCRRFGTMDLAFSLKTTADYTVLCAWAVTPAKDLLLLDVRRERMAGPELVPAAKALVEAHDLAYLGIEDAQAQTLVVQEARRAGLPVRPLKADRDKVSRATPAAVRMEAGQVYLPHGHALRSVVEQELLAFPRGAHDDIVDNLGYAAREVYQRGGGIAAETPADRAAADEARRRAAAEAQARHLNPMNEFFWRR